MSEDLLKEAKESFVSVFVTEFTTESYKEFQEEFLKAENSGQTVIPVYINSDGGEIEILSAMIDLFKSSKLPVSTIAVGRACSSGADLLAAGTKGYRYASPLSVIMIHEGEGGCIGSPSNIKTGTEELLRMFELQISLLDEHCGKEKGYWKYLLESKGNADYYMTAEEAKNHGLCDFVRLPRFKTELTMKTRIV